MISEQKHPYLKVSERAARAEVARIPHKRCQDAIPTGWERNSGGGGNPGGGNTRGGGNPGRNIDGRSVCWLFCWAKTGMGSPPAEEAARQAFDAIMRIGFDRFNVLVLHEDARSWRYSDDGPAVDRHLAELLKNA
ncbi:MAG: hypothetical protein ABL982_23910 [Vicinamibacterales bacterium]